MKTMTRLILRRVVSGNIRLTPRLLQVLKEFEQEPPEAGAPNNASASVTPANRPGCVAPADEKRLIIVSPLPGRWIRRTGCAAGLAFLLAIGRAHAAPDTGAMAAANNAFAQGQYSEAMHGFEAIIQKEGYSAPVLFNLANAQLRDQQFGPAILNYERAALLQPNDPDIAANLRVARQKAGVEVEPQSAFRMAAHTLTMNAWFGLAAGALFLFAVAWLLKLLLPQARRSLNLGRVLAALVLAVAAGALGLRGSELRRAVVVVPETVAGVSPVTVAEPVFRLRAGEIVRLQQAHGDFALVRNHAGYEGWVKAANIERIIPPAGT